ncbi:MAG: hypothetical protein QME21_01885 [Anaerolineales bacterium]|nr:hypothetical protein [Anaerolineales bacterium]
MYPITLALHNLVRWVALILGILAAARAFSGWFGNRAWSDGDRKVGSFFSIAMDVQLLLGLLLYFVFSPLTRTALSNLGAAMGSADLRFFALEHALYMFLAVIFAHLGSILARRATDAKAKHQRAAIFFGLALLLILLGMPWMRPLLPSL